MKMLSGPKSAATLATLINLGVAVRALGDIDSAETIYRRALKDIESIHGPKHPDVGKPANNLAVMLSQAGRPEEARPLALRAATIAETLLWLPAYGTSNAFGKPRYNTVSAGTS